MYFKQDDLNKVWAVRHYFYRSLCPNHIMDSNRFPFLFSSFLFLFYLTRTGNWILERSSDGVTFEPWQYYAITDTECLTRFNINPKTGPPSYTRDDEVICTSFYSKIHPLENGEVTRTPTSAACCTVVICRTGFLNSGLKCQLALAGLAKVWNLI